MTLLGPIDRLHFWSTRRGLVGNPGGPADALRRDIEQDEVDGPADGWYDPRFNWQFSPRAWGGGDEE